MSSRFYYRDKDTGKIVEGFPPQFEKFDTAPAVIQDSIVPYYHPRAQVMVDSRKELMKLDMAHGTITTDKFIPGDPTEKIAKAKRAKIERMDNLKEAVRKLENNEVHFTEAEKAKHKLRNEQLSKLLKIDAFNVAGRKTNGK